MKNTKKGPFPSFFRGAAFESRRTTYAHAGYVLAANLRALVPYEMDEADFDELVDRALSSDTPPAALLTLIEEHLPRCAAIVPSRRRRDTFLRGIEAAIDAERV